MYDIMFFFIVTVTLMKTLNNKNGNKNQFIL